MGRTVPHPPKVIVPKVNDTRRLEHIRYFFDSRESAEEAAAAFSSMGIDAESHECIGHPACTIKRVLAELKIDNRYANKMDVVAEKFGGKRWGMSITGLDGSF